MFIDCASSLSWAESALDVSTCLAPSHQVFSNHLKRFLLPVEHLSLQGIWRQDAENLHEFDSMVENQKLARDFAGNSFSATVCQASFLTCLITCSAWRQVGIKSPIRERPRSENESHAAERPSEDASSAVARPSKRRKVLDGVSGGKGSAGYSKFTLM